jgi:thioesterase domain-containing protein
MAVQLEEMGEQVALLGLMDTTIDYSRLSAEIDDEQDGSVYAEHVARTKDDNTPEESRAVWEKAQHVVSNNVYLAKQFTPSVYGGDVLFFNAIVPHNEFVSVIDPAVWKPFVLGKIDVHEIHCEHADMDKPEPLAVIGRALASRFEELQR